MGPVCLSTSFWHYFLHSTACTVLCEKGFIYLGPLLQPGSFTPPEGQMRAEMFSNATSSSHIKVREQVMFRKVVDAHEPPSHIWKADKARYLELVTGPGLHYKIHVELRRKLEISQATRLHFYFLYTSLKPFQFCFPWAQSRSESSTLNHG